VRRGNFPTRRIKALDITITDDHKPECRRHSAYPLRAK
jgi:hypothetical protein